jgi:hypothetical protein
MMSWTPVPEQDAPVMAEAVGATAFSYLGGWDALHSLSVRFYFNESRAIVWADLTQNTLDGQLAAVSAFAEVRDCYAGELELELRFGSESTDDTQVADSARIAVAK